MGLVPKGESGTHLIFHLSHPKWGDSVNSQTPRELCTLSYKDLDYAVVMCVSKRKGCYLAKSDMNPPFRNLPIHPHDRCWLIMMAFHPLNGTTFYFVDKCLPFGSSISCLHFQCFSNSITHIFKYKSWGKDTDNYLEDFLFVALLKAFCNGQVDIFLKICVIINFPVSLGKTVWGTQVLLFLGMLLNTVMQTVSIPEEKKNKAVGMIEAMLAKCKTIVLQLTGLLNFICRTACPERAFTRRFYAKIANQKLKQNHHIKVDKEIKWDCRTWLHFFHSDSAICRTFLDFSRMLHADEIISTQMLLEPRIWEWAAYLSADGCLAI